MPKIATLIVQIFDTFPLLATFDSMEVQKKTNVAIIGNGHQIVINQHGFVANSSNVIFDDSDHLAIVANFSNVSFS